MPEQTQNNTSGGPYAGQTDYQILRLLSAHTKDGLDPALAKEIKARFSKKDESIAFWINRVNELIQKKYGMDQKTAAELKEAKDDGRVLDHAPGEKVWDRLGQEWVINCSELRIVNGRLRQLYRCGHPGTCDYCTLYENEVFDRPKERTVNNNEKPV